MPDNDKSKNKNIGVKQEEDLRKILETALPLADFRQYVENNIPYEGYVFGVGKVKYYDMDTEEPFVIIPDKQIDDDPSVPHRRNETKENAIYDPWFWGGLAYGGFSAYKSFVTFDMHNPWYWKSAKGLRKNIQLLEKNAETLKYVAGRTGYAISRTLAETRATPLLKTATKVGYVGLVIPVASTIYKKELNVEDSTDFVFATVAFIPTVGWIIAGLYLVADTVSVLTTGEKISTHTARGVEKLNDNLFTKWLELNQGIKNWINSMSFGFYPIP